ncbi:DUF6777 domain-containing protein [Streptomyces sudanensis]|uniref:DUF6777 domain-containing protein n=1 Tax=Streptomyces sudanensis TaxID=436397 RepID=UPI0027E3F945|nr:DUF6777 domain-containing protein [Streptomyces sudanensis]
MPAQPNHRYAGSAPELYGGSGDRAVCDVERQIAYLGSDRDKAEAFASVVRTSPEDLPAYLRGLTPVQLRLDTLVTNHGYEDGGAVPYQAVLQAGTAVLVDGYGVPRVRCACGNPLDRPRVEQPEKVVGQTWAGFRTEEVVVVVPAPTPVPTFTVVDVETGERVERPAPGRTSPSATPTGPTPPATTGSPTPAPTQSPTGTPDGTPTGGGTSPGDTSGGTPPGDTSGEPLRGTPPAEPPQGTPRGTPRGTPPAEHLRGTPPAGPLPKTPPAEPPPEAPPVRRPRTRRRRTAPPRIPARTRPRGRRRPRTESGHGRDREPGASPPGSRVRPRGEAGPSPATAERVRRPTRAGGARRAGAGAGRRWHLREAPRRPGTGLPRPHPRPHPGPFPPSVRVIPGTGPRGRPGDGRRTGGGSRPGDGGGRRALRAPRRRGGRRPAPWATGPKRPEFTGGGP